MFWLQVLSWPHLQTDKQSSLDRLSQIDGQTSVTTQTHRIFYVTKKAVKYTIISTNDDTDCLSCQKWSSIMAQEFQQEYKKQ